MIKYRTEEQKNQFKALCTLIDFKYEYPGYTGDVRYGFYSVLPKHCLQPLFGNVLDQITPYIELDKGYVDARNDYKKNEKKYEYRNAVGNQFSTDDDFDEHHPEAVTESFENDLIRAFDYKTLSCALGCLSEVQLNRVRRYFFNEMTVREIAAEDKINHTAVVRSIQDALKKMKRFFE